MEQSSQMSAEQSLKLINETLRDSRLVITKRSGSHFILWGAILTLIALAVYFFGGQAAIRPGIYCGSPCQL